jgi:hypothetical protein
MLLRFERRVDLTEESAPTLTEIGNGVVQGAVDFKCNTASLWSFSCRLG